MSGRRRGPPDGRSGPRPDAPTVDLVYLEPAENWIPPWHRTNTSRIAKRYKLGLHYLHSAVEARGYRCRIFDQSVRPFRLEALIAHCRRTAPLAVGFYTAAGFRETVGPALEALRAQCPDVTLLCGGPGWFEDEYYLEQGCQVMVRGEGEQTLPELLEAVEAGRPLQDVRGISFRDGQGALVQTADRPPITDLDTLDFPYLTPELAAFGAGHSVIGFGRQMEVITSRGCPFHCAYCSSPNHLGRTLRQRSVANVLAEIDAGVERCGVRFINFLDDIFAWDADWLEEFTAALRRRPGLHFRCILHPLSFRRDPDRALRRLAEAGLVSFYVGVQTLDPEMRRLFHRSPAESEALIHLLAAARRHRVHSELQFIFALPADTLETYEGIYDFLLRARPNRIVGLPLTILPGSELVALPAAAIRCPLDEDALEQAARRLLSRFYRHPRTVALNLRYLLGEASRISPVAAWRALRSRLRPTDQALLETPASEALRSL